MAFVIGKVCPGIKNRTGAFLAGAVSITIGLLLAIVCLICLVYTFRELPSNRSEQIVNTIKSKKARTDDDRRMLQCYYGAGFAIWGCWILMSVLLIGGIKVENKRALGMWLCYNIIIPIYFIGGLIFLLVTDLVADTGFEIAYLVCQAINLIAMIWICLAIWVYFGEIRMRDKNPDMRENEIMFAQSFGGVLPPTGSYNPGYGAPSGGGSLSSIPRSQKSRHTYAPTEVDSVRTAPTHSRQSRLDQYRAQQAERSPIRGEQSPSPEREGGTTYYRYQYTAEQQQRGYYSKEERYHEQSRYPGPQSRYPDEPQQGAGRDSEV